MVARRQFLRLSAFTTAAAGLTACGTPEHPTAAPTGTAALSCPDPTPGTISNQSGPTSFVDAMAHKDGAAYQWQYLVLLSDKAGACTHYRANQIVQSEKWLLLTLIGSRDPMDLQPCPNPTTPITFTIPVTTANAIHQDGNLYTCAPHYAPHGTNCKESGGGDGTGGTVTYTLVTDQLVEGSYDLNVGVSHFTGTFSAPVCDLTGCPPRPSRSSCVAG